MRLVHTKYHCSVLKKAVTIETEYDDDGGMSDPGDELLLKIKCLNIEECVPSGLHQNCPRKKIQHAL
jgi:hypothetical protein